MIQEDYPFPSANKWRLNNLKFMEMYITEGYLWLLNTSNLMKKVQQRMFFLWRFKQIRQPLK